MKKDEIRQDPIKEKILESISYLDQNKSIVINILIGFIIIIGGFSYYNSLQSRSVTDASSIAGVAQNLYNANQSSEAISNLQKVLDEYNDTPSATHAYIYLLTDAYSNNDTLTILHLINNYNIKVSDPVLSANIYELKANFTDEVSGKIMNFQKAASLSTESAKGRIELSLAMIYIDNNQPNKAKELLRKYTSDETDFNLRNSATQIMSSIISK